MNQAREILSHTWQYIQGFLFPMLEDELGVISGVSVDLIGVF